MGGSLAKLYLLLLLFLGVTRWGESVTFDRKQTGVKFSSYVNAEGVDSSTGVYSAITAEDEFEINFLSTTTTNIKTMLQVVSTKFSRIITMIDNVVETDVLHGENHTHYLANANARTAETAAVINRENKNLTLTVIIGINPTWSEQHHSGAEVRMALKAFQMAHSIYPGTVEGFYLSNIDYSGDRIAQETLKWLKFLRNSTSGFGLYIGSEQACDESLNFAGIHRRNKGMKSGFNRAIPKSFEKWWVKRDIILNSDFLICSSSPGRAFSNAGAKDAFRIFESYTLKARDLIRSIHKGIEVMWSTSWPKSETFENKNDHFNLGIYWTQVDRFATKNNFPVWLNGAFGYAGLQSYIPWWKLTMSEHRNNVSAYVENFSNISARPPEEIPPGTTDFGKFGAVTLGTMLAVMVLPGIFFIVHKRWNPSRPFLLTKEEIQEFKLGSTKRHFVVQDNSVNVTAFNQPYDALLEIPLSRLEILSSQILGGGQYGCVFKALLKDNFDNEEEVAVKTTKPNCPTTAIRGLLSEIKILSYLGRHPNIIGILGAYTAEISKGNVYLALELCRLGSIKSILEKLKKITKELDGTTIPLNDMLRWSYEIACGMEYLEQKRVIHADLATRNVLLSSESVAKITDFGLSRRLHEYTNYVKTHQEPLPWRWMALESLKISEFSTKSDVWSYGVTLWEIFSLGAQPYAGLMWTLDFVEMLEDGLMLKRPRYSTSSIYNIMTECWNQDKDSRPSFSDLRDSTREMYVASMDESYTILTECYKTSKRE